MKVIAGKKDKQVRKITSAERGIQVTMLAAVNAIGNAISPFIVFPRVHFKDLMGTRCSTWNSQDSSLVRLDDS